MEVVGGRLVAIQFIGSLCVGVVGTVCHYLLLWCFLSMGNAPIFASSMGLLLGAVIVYLFNFYLTFSSKRNHRVALMRFVPMVFLGLILNSLVLQGGLVWLMLPLVYAQLLATGIQFLANFYISKKWVF